MDYSAAEAILKEQLEWLESLPKNFTTILDLACGKGYQAKFFHDRGFIVTAVDPYPAFLFGNEIEYIKGVLADLDKGRTFDAVLISHILEHIPDPQNFMHEIRSRIRNGGYCFVSVPRHVPVTTNDHRFVGWNSGQLAMFLVENGFDCSEATFFQTPSSVNGHGVKRDFESANFNIQLSLPYLPVEFRKLVHKNGNDEYMEGDIDFISSEKIVKKYIELFHDEGIFLDKNDEIFMASKKYSWISYDKHYDNFQDFSEKTLRVVCLRLEGNCHIRLGLGRVTAEGILEDFNEKWLTLLQGYNSFRVNVQALLPHKGNTDFKRINYLSIGSYMEDAQMRVFIYDESGRSLK